MLQTKPFFQKHQKALVGPRAACGSPSADKPKAVADAKPAGARWQNAGPIRPGVERHRACPAYPRGEPSSPCCTFTNPRGKLPMHIHPVNQPGHADPSPAAAVISEAALQTLKAGDGQ